MISKTDGTFVLSPSDLTATASCEFGWMRVADSKLGRLDDPLPASEDVMLKRAGTLGDLHEQRWLELLTVQHGSGVVALDRPSPYNAATLSAARDVTLFHLRDSAPVVAQGAFFDGGFGGLADFLILDEHGRYEVWDAKLARHAKITALLQIAAYADQLDREGIPRSPIGHLRLGDNSDFAQDLTEIIPVYLERRSRLERMLTEHIAEPKPVEWNDPRYTFCGTCEHCKQQIEQSNDLMLVAGMRKTQRLKLRASGIETMTGLANSTGPIDGVSPAVVENLRLQASLSIAPANLVDGVAIPPFQVIDAQPILALPEPSEGDIFFDFEGDPLWSDPAAQEYGLEYLWGVIEPHGDGVFKTWWAHDLVEERAALIGFLDYVSARRQEFPGMHIYHYAPYETTALKRLTGQRHQVGELLLDELLKAGVFVDLYQTVRQSLRVGVPSYSIKKLEPLYMGDYQRKGLDNAAESMVFYENFTKARIEGDVEAADRWLGEIATYNEDDCVSTWRLRDWLRNQVADHPSPTIDDEPCGPEEFQEPKVDAIAPLVDALLEHSGELGNRSADEQGIAMLAAALAYHRREDKPFWWSYYDRLSAWPGDWQEPRDFMLADHVVVTAEWHKQGRQTIERRTLEMRGVLEPASNIKAGSGYQCIYEDIPSGLEPERGKTRLTGGNLAIKGIRSEPDGDVLVIEEMQLKGTEPHAELPMAVCVASVVPTGSIVTVLAELAKEVVAHLPAWQASAGLDLIRRVPPRLASGSFLAGDGDPIDVIHASVTDLDHSYLAVQGPPGTGKTHVGSHVIKRLVEAGWKVGVVAQSHEVVDNFLRAAIEAGLDAATIAKPNKQGDDSPRPWEVLGGEVLGEFIEQSGQSGCLIGGVTWTFCNRKVVPEAGLDLLVVDEAGQFSLANTLASAVSAKNLLLLGDPQQLPQVSQGAHPEPVDTSALGWIMGGHETMAPDRGYFLARTWRMHSALSEPVSDLAYAGELRSQIETTDVRDLSGIAPGLHVVNVDHTGSSVACPEEAVEVVTIVRAALTESWRGSASAVERKVEPADVLAVAPYNAQVALIRIALDAAGYSATRVGTVDKFQGQEAPVVVVSMTASSADDVPRGMDFLLNRNRLNVAISRGQWAAYVVRSRSLTDFLPTTPAGLAELGAFIRMTEQEEGKQ